jgi:hypothetical protein
MTSPLLPSMQEQLDALREDGFTLVHIDTCLGSYLTDHHNRDGELLLGVHIDATSTVGDVLLGVLSEFQSIGFELGESRGGFDFDLAKNAIKNEIASKDADELAKLFDTSLEVGDEEDDDDGESVQAWFLIVWPVPVKGMYNLYYANEEGKGMSAILGIAGEEAHTVEANAYRATEAELAELVSEIVGEFAPLAVTRFDTIAEMESAYKESAT